MISEGLLNSTTRLVVLVLPIALASGCATQRPAPTPPAIATTPPPTADPARILDLGRALLARSEMVAATVALREALRLKPDLAEARASLGLALYAMGDLDAAVEELRGLLRVRPDLAEARLTLAAALVARQDWPASPISCRLTTRSASCATLRAISPGPSRPTAASWRASPRPSTPATTWPSSSS